MKTGLLKFFKDEIVSYPKDIPVNNNVTKTFNCIAKKIKPSQEEIAKNPRSRSAVMGFSKTLDKDEIYFHHIINNTNYFVF